MYAVAMTGTRHLVTQAIFTDACVDGIILQKPQQAKTPGEQLSIISIFFLITKTKS